MASSSGRYQSRLFNWLSQGLGQLDKFQPHIRRLKMRATWGVQAVFYWAYGLIQTVWSTGPRLGRAGQPPLATGSIPSSSQPIQQILLEVQQFYLFPGLETADSALAASQQDISASVPIQGIATLLATRTLVLVTEQNQLLDLTLDQQKQLQCRIAQEISSDRHWGRIAQATQRHLNLRFQTALGQILSWMPKRLAQPIITRLKTRSIGPAISPQLQEPSSNFGLVANPQSKIGKVLGFLDSVSLQLERQAGRVFQVLQQRFHQNLTPEQDAFRDNNPKIQALIRAAIAYFFDWKPLKFLRHSSTQAAILGSDKPYSSISEGSHQPSQNLGQSAIIGTESTLSIKPGQEEPWLTLTDLFGGSTETSLVGCGSGVASVSMTQTSQRLTKTSEQTPTQSHQVEASGTSASAAADAWMDIETEAILMGYIKHPLERVLEWLDRGLAWLEGLVVALWTHLRPYLSALFQLIQQYWRR
jgi:hypothetical protein